MLEKIKSDINLKERGMNIFSYFERLDKIKEIKNFDGKIRVEKKGEKARIYVLDAEQEISIYPSSSKIYQEKEVYNSSSIYDMLRKLLIFNVIKHSEEGPKDLSFTEKPKKIAQNYSTFFLNTKVFNNEYTNILGSIIKYISENHLEYFDFWSRWKGENNSLFDDFKTINTFFMWYSYKYKFQEKGDLIFKKQMSPSKIKSLSYAYGRLCDAVYEYLKNINKDEEFLESINEKIIDKSVIKIRHLLEKYNQDEIENEKLDEKEIFPDKQSKDKIFLDKENRIKENMLATPRSVWTFLYNLIDSRDKKISIPIYQRKYVWEEKNFLDLLEDIYKMSKRNNVKQPIDKECHYIGNIVLKEHGNDQKLVDGQQRLSSIFILLKALTIFIHHKKYSFNLKEQKLKEIWFILKELFNKKDNPFILTKFTRNEENIDDNVFRDLWENNFENLSSNNDNSNIYINFNSSLQFLEKNFGSEKNHKKFDNFLENLFFQTYFVEISKLRNVDDLILFEKMNTLGAKLTALDLVKNKIASKYRETIDKDQTNFEKEFYEKIEELFENKSLNKKTYKQQANKLVEKYINYFTDFSKECKTAFEKYWDYIEKNISKKIDTNLSEKNQLKKLLDYMNKDILLFLDIYDNERHSKNDNRLYFIFDYLTTLVSPKKNNYIILIKEILLSFNIENNFGISNSGKMRTEILDKKNKIRELLSILENFEFRSTIVNPASVSIGPKIAEIREAWKNKLKNYDNDVKKITNYDFYHMLKKAFQNTQLKFVAWNKVSEVLSTNKEISKEFARELLLRIETFSRLKGNAIKDNSTMPYSNTKKNQNGMTAEHIMPQNPDKKWKDLLQNDYETTLSLNSKIGNYLLLIKSSNAGANNNLLNVKINHYKKDAELLGSLIYNPDQKLLSFFENKIDNNEEKAYFKNNKECLSLSNYIEKEKIFNYEIIKKRTSLINIILKVILDNLREEEKQWDNEKI